jgi:2-oxo-4-hydroxy-4-carboxy-5-ureidoimidazoline decarboxylase
VTVSLEELNARDRAGFTAALGHVFEHSPWVAEETWAARPFSTVADLHAALCQRMRAAPRDRQLALIRAHPDLAAAGPQPSAHGGVDAGAKQCGPRSVDGRGDGHVRSA